MHIVRSLRHIPARALTATRVALASTSTSSKPGEHTTNKKDELDVQSSASMSGMRERAEGSENSSATSQKDTENNNERAKKDNPEAPGPIIGMNDERGGKGH